MLLSARGHGCVSVIRSRKTAFLVSAALFCLGSLLLVSHNHVYMCQPSKKCSCQESGLMNDVFKQPTCSCNCPLKTSPCKRETRPKARQAMVKPLLILSWTAMTMTRSHDELWYGDGSDLKHAFNRCYERKFLDPNIYPCHYTNNRTYFERSEVVLFRGRRMSEIPLPATHPPEQSWLFYDFEPPYKVWKYTNLTQFNGVFNLTSTYSRDSDVPFHYDLKHCVRQNWRYKKLSSVDYMVKKTRNVSVAWFASVCQTQSKREQYVNEMRKYIDVDVYGQCGKLRCGGTGDIKWVTDHCDEKLLHGNDSYMFYLAFENSLCDDYITEKLWRMLKIDIIPVVMGAVEYSNIMPKDSFIDVRDYSSPKSLAEYLHTVMTDRHLYNEYIRNKNSLSCTSLKPYMPQECVTCKALHDIRGQNKVVYKLDSFWGSRRCISPFEFFKSNDDASFNLSSPIQLSQS